MLTALISRLNFILSCDTHRIQILVKLELVIDRNLLIIDRWQSFKCNTGSESKHDYFKWIIPFYEGEKKWVKVVWYRINYFGIFFKWNHVFFNMVYSEKLLFKFCRIKEVWKKKTRIPCIQRTIKREHFSNHVNTRQCYRTEQFSNRNNRNCVIRCHN